MHIYRYPIKQLFELALILLVSPLPGVTAAPSSKSAENGPIPIEVLFRPPYISRARLSPNGTSIAGLNQNPNGVSNLVLLKLGEPNGMILKGKTDEYVRTIRWLNDETLLTHTIRSRIYAGGLYAIKINEANRWIQISNGNSSIVGSPKARPNNVILWSNLGDLNEYLNTPELFETTIDDNALRNGPALYRPAQSVTYPEVRGDTVMGYDSDANGELALCYFYADTKLQVRLFNATSRTWEHLPLVSALTAILSVEADHKHLWVSEYNPPEGFQLRRFTPESGERGPALITDPLFNPSGGTVHYSDRENKLAGISYQQRRLKNVWFEPRFADLQSAVDRLLPHTDNLLVDTDRKERYFLYYSESDNIPGAYYLLDGELGTLKLFAQAYPWLAGFEFSKTHAIKFPTRDGLDLEGYLTVPKGATASNKVPLVVLCHGGPASRDEWGFDPEVQFLASRGYAVLQPNYRGSSGYKPSISKDWEYDYRRMHDDVTDATKTFRQLDMIDRNRVAIMGASFGGYLAVSGAAFEEGLYRCAITNSGVFDWELLTKNAKWDGRPGEYEMLKDHVGKPGKDRDYFESISPLASIDNIKIPVFIAHGKDDNVVNLNQSTKLASALKRRKIPVETFFPSDELHGFRSPENKAEYYHRIEVFLAKYLR